MNYDLITILIVAGAAAVAFLPTIPLMLLPCVRRLRGGAKAGMWIFACGVYLLTAGLVAAWAGDVIQNRGGDQSVIAFYGYIVVYILAPIFYAVFFREGVRSIVYPIIIAVLALFGAVGLGLVPLFYGVNTEFDLLTRVLGVAGTFVPQLAAAALYAVLAKLSHGYVKSGEADY